MRIEDNSALIVIDAQNDFVENMVEPKSVADEAVDKIVKVIDFFREKKLPIIYFRELHRKELVDFGRELDGDEPVHCVEGTRGAQLVDKIQPKDGEYIIGKRRYSTFFGTDLEILLKGLNVKTIYIVGFITDVCVHYSAVDAHQYDYHVKIFKDAVAGSSLAAHDASLNAIGYLQVGSVIEVADLNND
ncbi:MAG: isochorismatase family cysteine hydrolase [Ignavibacteria bacterium]|nr:isochorismatase family cysteine hydrolase [Ignavibacteria bacterium]